MRWPPGPKTALPTFVLVHGALFTGAGWTKVQEALSDLGGQSVAPNVPGRANDGISPKSVSLYSAAAHVCEAMKAQTGKVILVGHSQGGALINQALQYCGSQVDSLVYIAAVLPLNGEIPFQGLDPKVDTGWGKVTTYDKEAQIFHLNKSGPVHEIFFEDISRKEAEYVIAGMVSEPAAIGTASPVTTPNEFIFSKRLFYIETTSDKLISLQSQRRFHTRIPGISVITMNASHSPFLSQPVELAKHLAKIGSGPCTP